MSPKRVVFVAVAFLAVILAVPGAAAKGELKPVKGAITASDFVVRDLVGKPARFSAFRGKVVLLNFWATWCPPCRQEMPAMERLYQAYRERGLVVLAVSQDQAPPAEVESFAVSLGLTFPVWHDRDGLVGRQYSVPGLPTSFLVAADGHVAYRVIGEYEWFGAVARGTVERLLTEAGR